MPISTDTKAPAGGNTPPSGVLSPRQITALIQKNQWWPFTRVDGRILVRLHKQTVLEQTNQLEESPL